MSTYGWTILFLETNGPHRTTDMGENVFQKPIFQLSFSRYGFLWRKNLKTVFDTLFPTEKVIFIFVIRWLIPSKMVVPRKIIFRCSFGKYYFFSKKLLNKKYSKPHFLLKRLYWLLSLDGPFPSKRSSPINVFSNFSPKILCFLKNLFNNKLSGQCCQMIMVEIRFFKN